MDRLIMIGFNFNQIQYLSNIIQYFTTQMIEEDSFEEYKKYLEDFIHDATKNTLKPPKMPFNAYMHFILDKSSLERLNSPHTQWSKITTRLSKQWKNISQTNRNYYIQAYQRRLKYRERVMKQYQKVTRNKKISTPYIRFFKKVYPAYQKKYIGDQISKMIINEWKNMDENKKKQYFKDYDMQKFALETRVITPQDRQQYRQLCQKYEKQINDQKIKISRKEEITKSISNFQKINHSKAKIRKQFQKEQEKQRDNLKQQSDSDSENVQDLVKKVLNLKKRKQKKIKSPNAPKIVKNESDQSEKITRKCRQVKSGSLKKTKRTKKICKTKKSFNAKKNSGKIKK